MLFMVIERFKDGKAAAVYRRLRERGRGLPAGLTYRGSWVGSNFDRCFQLMACDDARLLEEWAQGWRDLADFEFVPVVSSEEAAARLADR